MKQLIPYKELKLKSIIDELDFPLLSHYTNDKDENILMYVVEFDDDAITLLLWKIYENDLFDYLTNKITLKDLILETNKEFLYLAQSNDFNINELQVEFLSTESIPSIYLPDNSSYYGFELPKNYEYLEERYGHSDYVVSLTKRGVVLKIAPKSKKFGDTVSLKNIVDFTSKVNTSYNSYVEQDFYKNFKDNIDDFKKFNKYKKQVSERSIPRVCDTVFGSFEITISNDNLNNGANLPKEILNWSNSILQKFAENVLYKDYANDDVLKLLLETISPLELKTIYEPFLNTITQDEYIVDIRSIGTDKEIKFNKNYKKTRKEVRKLISSKLEVVNPLIEKKKLVHVIYEVGENIEIKDLNKSQLSKDLIFSFDSRDFIIFLSELQRPEKLYILKNKIEFKVQINDENLYLINYPEFEINLKIEDKNLILEIITSHLNQLIAQKFKNDVAKFFEKFGILEDLK